jgi:hypothetical protein
VNRIAFCGDRDSRPREAPDLAHLGIGLARLDLRRVEDRHVATGRVGDVGAVAVIAERHPVREGIALPEHVRLALVADIDGGDRLGRRPSRVERVAVEREPALVAEAREQLGELPDGGNPRWI